MRNRLHKYQREICAILAAGIFIITGVFLDAGASLWVVCLSLVVGAFFLHIVEKTVTVQLYGYDDEKAVRVGRYPVHMLRAMERMVVVVTCQWDVPAESQNFRLHILSLRWFVHPQDVARFTGVSGVVMIVRPKVDGTMQIELERAKSGLRIVTAQNQHNSDPA